MPTKSQLRAAAHAKARNDAALWKTLIPAAYATWPQLAKSDLVRTQGNFHALAGMVQLYCRTSRQNADTQVEAFFQKHARAPDAAPSTLPAAAPSATLPTVGTL